MFRHGKLGPIEWAAVRRPRPGDLLVIASDGIAENHLHSIDFAAPSATIAEQLVARYGKETDDALVLAARHRGTS